MKNLIWGLVALLTIPSAQGGSTAIVQAGKIQPGATPTVQHTVPTSASDTFTMNAATQTLTNKSISGATNTLTAIPNSALDTISTAGKVSGSAITSGTIGGSTAISTSGNISAGAITGTSFVGATASMVGASAGANVCPAATTTQAFLACLDAAVNGISPGGGMDLSSDQTAAGIKTFSSPPILSSLTASTVPYLDASKQFASSAATPTQLGYLANSTSNLCGISQSCTLSNKTIPINADVFTLRDPADTSKQAQFIVSGVTAGQIRSFTFPDANTTLVGATAIQTLTNKVLSGNTAASLISGSGTIVHNTSGTITVPNGTDTLVGKATTDVLTNKTLSGNTATNLISGSGTLTLNTSGTATVPNATDTLVGKATTDVLTNKTIDADGTGNSITNIENADIKSGAAIAYSKLNLTGAVLNADLAGSIADTKLSQITTASKVSTSAITGTLGVANGGTGLTSYTSGGIPYGFGTNTMAFSSTLTAGNVVLGGGLSGAPNASSSFTWDAASGLFTTHSGTQGLTISTTGSSGSMGGQNTLSLKNRDSTVSNGTQIWNLNSQGALNGGLFFINADQDASGSQTGHVYIYTTKDSSTLTAAVLATASGTSILGTTTNNDASAGYVGEVITATGSITNGNMPLDGVVKAIVTPSVLTAGDWDCVGQAILAFGGTTSTAYRVGLTTTSTGNGFDDITGPGVSRVNNGTFNANADFTIPVSTRRFKVANGATQQIYLSGALSYSVLGSATWQTSYVHCRRAR